MKRLILVSLIFCMLFSFPAFAEENNGINVSVTDFTYTGSNGERVSDITLLRNSITASGTLQSIKGEGEQNYSFFMTVTKNGKYFSSDIKTGTLYGDETKPLSLTAALPDDKSGVEIETCIWENLSEGKALIPKSVFGSPENEIIAIYVDGVMLSDIGGDDYEGEFTFPASLSHTPRIQAVAKELGAKIEIDEIVSIPQDVKIKVTSQAGEEKIYTLFIKQKDGEISDAYILDKDGMKNPVTKDVLRRPDYGNGLKPGDDGFDLITAVPETSTAVYSDRTNFYYYDIPDKLLGKTVLQPPRQILAYDDKHLDKNNAKEVMGGFTINRSANVYVYGVGEDTDWIVSEGYVRADDSYKLSRTQNTAAAYIPEVFVKTYPVSEGETVTVNLGNATSSSGVNASYHLLVDFLSPMQIAGIRNVSVEGEEPIDFDPMITDYDINLFNDHSIVPDIFYEVFGAGATVNYQPAPALPGTSKVTVTSKDGSYTKTYNFHLHEFENVLTGIKVGGADLEGFGKHIYDYTYKLPYGDNEVKEITAEASKYIDVDIVQATDENKTATITLTDMDGNVATYTVTFELTLERPSVEKKLACSWTGILSSGFSIDPLINISNPSADHLLNGISLNHSVVATNNTSVYKNSILYNRIDLSKLVNKAQGKPVYYNLYTQLGSDNVTEVTTDIEMYLADDGIWSTLNGTDMVAAAGKAADIAGLTSGKLIGSAEISRTGGYWSATADFYSFDITEVVDEALSLGENYITVGIRLVPVENNSNYIMRLRVWQNSSTQSNISYYAYE